MNIWVNQNTGTSKAIVRKLIAPMFAILVGGATPLLPSVANAQPAIAPNENVVKVLRDRYAETPAFIGLARTGVIVEVFTSEKGETWTIVVTRPDGMSQVVAAGKLWEKVVASDGRPIYRDCRAAGPQV